MPLSLRAAKQAIRRVGRVFSGGIPTKESKGNDGRQAEDTSVQKQQAVPPQPEVSPVQQEPVPHAANSVEPGLSGGREQYERLLEECALSKAQWKQASLELGQAKAAIHALEGELAAAQARREQLELLQAGTSQQLAELTQEQRRLIEDFFRLRDQLLMYRDGATGDVLKFIGLMYRETGSVLKKSGIESLETAEGLFDESYQTVADTVETTDKEQHMKVNEMFRPGYRRGEELLRREEVIVSVIREGV